MSKSNRVGCKLALFVCNTTSFERILDGVKDGSLYGSLIVDISTPVHLKEKFADFPPIIKNAVVSRDDIGPYIQKIAEEYEYLKTPQRYFISSYFGKRFWLIQKWPNSICK